MDSTSAKFDTNVTLRKNTFVKEGYHFTGWGSLAEPNKVLYSDAATVKNLTPKGSFTLVAQWAPNEYSVRFNNNMDPAKYQEIHVKYDESFTVPADLYSRDGYTFCGWGDTATALSSQYVSGQLLRNVTSKNADIVNFYAIWKPNSYTINFQSSRDLSSMPDSMQKNYGQEFNLPVPKCLDTGYTFIGWKDLQTEKFYAAGTTVSNLVTANKGVITLDAVFDESQYEVSWFTDSEQQLDTVKLKYFDIYEIPDFKLTKVGYVFKCWSYQGENYRPGDQLYKLTTSSTAKFTAKWEPNTYTVKFDSNGGSGLMADIDCNYDESTKLPANTFTNKGKMFVGWSTTPNGKVAFRDESSVTSLATSGTVTLYAVWAEAEYVITFTGNGGEGRDFIMKSKYSETITIPQSRFTKQGNTFIGWGETPDLVKYNPGDRATGLVSGTELTLYAIWEQNSYNLILHGAASDGVSDVVKTLKYSEELDLSKIGRKT